MDGLLTNRETCQVRLGLVASTLTVVVSVAVVACSSRDARQVAPHAVTEASAASGVEIDMRHPRAAHRAVRLADSRVLITGGCTEPGCGGFDAGRRSELYDPADRVFRPGPAMRRPRANDTATLLADGRVLLVGGYPGEGMAPTASAEVYDPDADRFERVSNMANARAGHSATLLPDGRVLICGGVNEAGRPLDTVELFDPRADAFAPGPTLSAPRAAHIGVAVGNRVVLVGGTGDSGDAAPIAATDVFDGAHWTPGPRLRVARVKHAAVAVPAEQAVLVIGGSTSMESRERMAGTELIHLATGRVNPGPNMSESQYKLDEAVATLPDGRIVIGGGSRINVYDPDTNDITVVPEPAVPRRSFPTATVVGPQQVLIAGGYDDAIAPTRDARVVTIPTR